MALLSDIDWLIILAVGALLLFGQQNGTLVRQLGRYYGRAMRLKQELLAEVTKAADLPLPPPGQSLSIRSAFLGLDPPATHRSGIPVAVSTAPSGPVRPLAVPEPWVGSSSFGTWSVALPAVPGGTEVDR
ncbi:MAG: hypothetical protein WAN87_00310 [Thermoplasmata archaeon]